MICKAIITGIAPGTLKVKTVVPTTGCTDCALSRSCCSSNPSTVTERFSVKVDDTSGYSVGQEIYLEQTGVNKRPMLIYGVVLPIVILALLIAAFLDNEDPTLGITLGIIAVALYFLAMRKLHAPLSPRPRWQVRKGAVVKK